MVDNIEAPDPHHRGLPSQIRHLTRSCRRSPTLTPSSTRRTILDKDPHWYEKNIMGTGPFKFVSYEIGQSIKGERNPDYYHAG